jgi:hypothetical protein
VSNHVLSVNQQRLQRIINELNFGVIEKLLIRDGTPCFDSAPRIIQAIKLDSDSELISTAASVPLKKGFDNLFEQIRRLADGLVDVEVRHGLPFRLVVEWRETRGHGREEIG